jgi:PAS domain S-box-containing protein
MEQKKDWIEKRQSLRREVDVMLSSITPVAATAQPMEVMTHELLVHRVELEMQIEELKSAHNIMEEARDRYVDLYESAPVGYIAINRECLITETNLTAAAMLGVDRVALINRRFANYISPQDKDLWYLKFTNLARNTDIDNLAFALEMMRADNTSFHVYLDCRQQKSFSGPEAFRLTLIDIGTITRAEAEMHNTITPAAD